MKMKMKRKIVPADDLRFSYMKHKCIMPHHGHPVATLYYILCRKKKNNQKKKMKMKMKRKIVPADDPRFSCMKHKCIMPHYGHPVATLYYILYIYIYGITDFM